MKLKLGMEIVYGNIDTVAGLRTGIITKITPGLYGNDLVFVDNCHRAEDCISKSYCWPIEFKEKLVKIVKTREKLRQAYEYSIKLVYELRDEVTRA